MVSPRRDAAVVPDVVSDHDLDPAGLFRATPDVPRPAPPRRGVGLAVAVAVLAALVVSVLLLPAASAGRVLPCPDCVAVEVPAGQRALGVVVLGCWALAAAVIAAVLIRPRWRPRGSTGLTALVLALGGVLLGLLLVAVLLAGPVYQLPTSGLG